MGIGAPLIGRFSFAQYDLPEGNRLTPIRQYVVVVPFHEGHPYIDRLLTTLDQYSGADAVIIVDDHSLTPLRVDDLPETALQVTITRPSDRSYFAGAVNWGFTQAQSWYGSDIDVLVLNQDTYFTDDRPFTKTIPNYITNHAYFGERIRGSNPTFPRGYVHGTFLYFRADAINSVGFLNGDLYPLWGCTAEYQLRVFRAGLITGIIPEIPGFVHERKRSHEFGSSISSLLKKDPNKLYVRTPPEVTVIVACYNYGHFLKDCIASLLGGESSLGYRKRQTLQSLEIIIVDDCSTDDSYQVALALADTNAGIRAYQTSRNVGTASVLNYGVANSTGRYITFLSADDMREPDSLMTLYKACEANPGSFAYDDVLLWQKNGFKTWRMGEPDLYEIRELNHIHAGIMFSRAAYHDVGGWPPSMGRGREDWAMNVALLSKGHCGVHIKEPTYIYRRHNSNRTLSNSSDANRARWKRELQRLFPEAYLEDLSHMPCCGGHRAAIPNNQKSTSSPVGGPSKMSADLGSLTKIQYIGDLMTKTYTGSETLQRYRFGVDRSQGFVYDKDLEGFLEYYEAGRPVFRVVAPEPEVEYEALSAPRSLVADEGVGVVNEDAETLLDASEFTVAQIKAMRMTRDDWIAFRHDEATGKNRITVLNFIDEKLS